MPDTSEFGETRKNAKTIIKALMMALGTEQLTTQQVADLIGSSWETAYTYLHTIVYIQTCPKVVMDRVGKRIHTWKREWGRLPE